MADPYGIIRILNHQYGMRNEEGKKKFNAARRARYANDAEYRERAKERARRYHEENLDKYREANRNKHKGKPYKRNSHDRLPNIIGRSEESIRLAYALQSMELD